MRLPARAATAVAGLLLLPAGARPQAAKPPAPAESPARVAAPAANVVSDGTRGIRVAEAPRDTAVLVVLVVDDAGDPLDEVTVAVLSRGREIASGRTDSRGRAVLRLELAVPVVVRAEADGFVPATARGVVLRKGGLTAVALPLEQKEP